jgi:hypothetical protein
MDHSATKANAAAAPPTTQPAFPVIIGTPAVLVFALLDGVAAVCSAPVELAVDFSVLALPLAFELPLPVDVLPEVDDAVLAAAAGPAVRVTIRPARSVPEIEVVSTEDTGVEAELPRKVSLHNPLVELVITQPMSIWPGLL